MDHVRRCQLFAVITLLTGALVVQGARLAQADSPKTSIEPLGAAGTVIPGTGSILVRTKDGVGATLHTFGLVPGNAYTLWVAVFNNPKECVTNPCTAADVPNPDVQAVILWGTGQIAGEDGTVDFGAFRAVGDTSGSAGLGTATALERPLKAEIHLVVRSHGPADLDPAVLQESSARLTAGVRPIPARTCRRLHTCRKVERMDRLRTNTLVREAFEFLPPLRGEGRKKEDYP
jgi:hypothetical protein